MELNGSFVDFHLFYEFDQVRKSFSLILMLKLYQSSIIFSMKKKYWRQNAFKLDSISDVFVYVNILHNSRNCKQGFLSILKNLPSNKLWIKTKLIKQFWLILNKTIAKNNSPGKEMLFKLNYLFLLHLRQFAGFNFII